MKSTRSFADTQQGFVPSILIFENTRLHNLYNGFLKKTELDSYTVQKYSSSERVNFI